MKLIRFYRNGEWHEELTEEAYIVDGSFVKLTGLLLPADMIEDVISMYMEKGKKIEAIKFLRSMKQSTTEIIGLKEAKETVEFLWAKHSKLPF